eukprot:5661700-Ditylum_brightwellii.AAC.1
MYSPGTGSIPDQFFDLDAALAGHIIATPICRGILKGENQDKTLIIPWSDMDPDSKINCFPWSEDESKWQIPISQHLPGAKSIKGSYHIGMLQPMIAKHAKPVQDRCVVYKGAFSDDLLLEIYAVYKEASDLKFKMWAISEHQKYKE